MNISKQTMQFNGFPINDAQKELERLSQMSNSEFFEWQTKKRWEIYEYHFKNNESYKSFIGSKISTEWNEIPIMDKHSIQKPVSARLSNEFKTNKVFINHTSGSTGTPFYFAKDKFCHAMTWAMIADRYSWHKINIFKDKQARFYHIPNSFFDLLKERIKDILMNRKRFNVLDLSDNVQKEILSLLKKGKYDYINGYTVSLTVFAKYLLKNKITLKDEFPSIRACIVTSGMLFAEDREILSKAFKIPVLNEYGASELSLIAFEDIDSDWLINDEEIYVEVVDNAGNLIQNGRPGRILVTSLYNKAMPFIRYDLGDIAVLSKEKKGKHTKLKSLIGRANDSLLLKDGQMASEALLEFAIKPILSNNYELKEYLIRQWNYDRFTFEYISDVEIDQGKQVLTIKTLEESLGHQITFDFIRLSKIQRTNTLKLKYFERMC